MKKIVIYLLFITYTNIYCQNLSVKVVYNQAIKDSRITKSDSIKIFKDLEYQLLCNTNESEFRIIEKMNSDASKSNRRFAARIGATSLQYRSLIDKEKIRFFNFLGDNYIVKLPFNEYNWKLTKESKKIGKYTCYKGVTFTTINTAKSKTKTITYKVIAWYTPDIPLSFGPNGFDGLPGLILEVNWRNNYLIAKDINIKKLDDSKIERPNKGIEMSSKEFETYVRETFLNKQKD